MLLAITEVGYPLRIQFFSVPFVVFPFSINILLTDNRRNTEIYRLRRNPHLQGRYGRAFQLDI